MLKAAGVGEEEAAQILTEAKVIYYGQVLKEIGIPAVSLKKYVAAGFTSPESFCAHPVDVLSTRTGMSPGTVQRHVDLVCTYLKKPVPKKYTKLQLERGKKELLKIKGIDTALIEKLSPSGIINASALLEADADKIAAETGIPAHKIREYQEAIQKKRDSAVIQL
jgi:DNA topoisomerase-1